MKYVSLFAGIGGFDLALNRLGHECVYANDFDKYCKITYDKHFTPKLDTTPIQDVKADTIPDHELLVGGFPCQAFSIAGKRKGFDEARGTLFFEIVRILAHKRPRYFLLENVKGLLSHDSGKTFQTILRLLAELGYECQWQVLNSKNFGVPQNRERVFIVGHFGGVTRPKVFPIGEGNAVFNRESKISATLDSNYHKGANWNRTFIKQLNQPTHSNDRIYGQEGISPTLNTAQGGNRQPKIVQRVPLKFLQRNQKNIKGDYAFTVDGANTGGVKQGTKIRRLTPIECERLQGFPDNWTEVTKSSIMEICVNINPVIENLLPRLDTVSCTISVGKDMEHQIYSLKKSLPVTFVIDGLLLENFATNIIKAGNAMVIHYNPKEISQINTKTQQNHIDEKMGEKSIYKLWKIILGENLSKEKLSTILTSIKEIMTSPIFSSVNQEQNIIGYIILSNSQEQNYTKGRRYSLMVINTKSLMSDTQRYKQLGNAVTVNVVYEIMKRFSSS